MKYVAIKHKPEHTNVWWFSVPEELEDRVYIGADVLCITRKGKASGKIMYIMEGIPQKEAEKIIGKHFPLKSIMAVSVDFPMEEIHIPMNFLNECPTSEKIAKRVTEFYATGRFDTPVIISPDGNLRDGYTAYLVAKMFDHDVLRGFCVAD